MHCILQLQFHIVKKIYYTKIFKHIQINTHCECLICVSVCTCALSCIIPCVDYVGSNVNFWFLLWIKILIGWKRRVKRDEAWDTGPSIERAQTQTNWGYLQLSWWEIVFLRHTSTFCWDHSIAALEWY